MGPCERYQEIISPYLDGEATAEQKAILEAHLRRCPDCRAVERRMKALQQTLRELPQLTTSPEFNIALRARIRLEERAARGSVPGIPIWGRMPAFGVAVAAVAIALAVFLAGPGGERKQPLSGYSPTVAEVPEGPAPGRVRAPLPRRNVQYVMEKVPAEILGQGESVSIDSRNKPTRLDSTGDGGELSVLAGRIYRVSF